jgi:hypothetical protein
MEKETLHFKIGISSTSDKKHPQFAILVNDQQFVADHLSSSKNQTQYFEFDAELNEGNHLLIIEFKNKTNEDTVLDKNGNIIEDLLLNIDSIEIEDIDLGTIIWTSSEYKPNYPAAYRSQMQAQGTDLAESIKNCVNLGWNGQWTLPFTTPFYMWLLENI